MAIRDRRTVTYTTDKGDTVNIEIAYEELADAPPDTRYTLGGFGPDNNEPCAAIVTRRRLKPRFVNYQFGDRTLTVYVANSQTYNNLLDDTKTASYCGECGSC